MKTTPHHEFRRAKCHVNGQQKQNKTYKNEDIMSVRNCNFIGLYNNHRLYFKTGRLFVNEHNK